MQSDIDNNRLIRNVFLRPKMFSADIETLRDLLMFVQGVSCGLDPPHGALSLLEFGTFLKQRLSVDSKLPWTLVLLESFGNVAAIDVCEDLARLFQEWRESLPSHAD
jgi:hypothetical protein